MVASTVLLAITGCTQSSLFEINYGPVSHYPEWEVRQAQCSDRGTDGVSSYYRVMSKNTSDGAVDNSNVHYVRTVCQSLGMGLPSAHSELDSWCIFNTGVYGTKARIATGLTYNRTKSQWFWDDESAYNFTKMWPPNWTPPSYSTHEPWCARIGSTLYWTPFLCDTSGVHTQKDFIVCTRTPPPMTTILPLTDTTLVTTSSTITTNTPITATTTATANATGLYNRVSGALGSASGKSREGTSNLAVSLTVGTLVLLALAGVLHHRRSKESRSEDVDIEEDETYGPHTPHPYSNGQSSIGDDRESLYDEAGVDMYYQANGSDHSDNEEATYDLTISNDNPLEDEAGYLVPSNTNANSSLNEEDMSKLYSKVSKSRGGTSEGATAPYDLAVDDGAAVDEDRVYDNDSTEDN